MFPNIQVALAKMSLLLLSIQIAYAATTSPATYSILPASPQNQAPVTSSTIEAWVDSEALRYAINPNLANCLVSNESHWDPYQIGDVGNPHGASYGLWQIEVKQHPDITVADATDWKYATDWALQFIAAGNVSQWTTYGKYCHNISIH